MFQPITHLLRRYDIAALVQTAHALTALLGETENVARLGSDEFAIVQRPVPQPANAIAVASAIVQRMAQPICIDRIQVAIFHIGRRGVRSGLGS